MSRINYWSCSKFSDWLRKLAGAPRKLESGTAEEWNAYKKAAKKYSPFIFWLAEDGLDTLQDIICWPTDKLYAITYYIQNRFIEKTHVLSTGLAPQYYDIDTRILHGLFETLVRFVEEEKAWMEYCCNHEKYPNLPFWKTTWPFRHFTRFKYPELGLKYLQWETSLKQDDDYFAYTWRIKDEGEQAIAAERAANPDYMKPTQQAEHAMQIIALYNWWKVERPARPDPYDVSGWTVYCEERRKQVKQQDPDADELMFFGEEKSPAEKQYVKMSLDTLNKMEEDQNQEDTDKMIELVRIRQSLWT